MRTKSKLLTSAVCLLMLVFCAVGLFACSEDKTCTHQWGEWSTTKSATCTEAGAQERKCTQCGETETAAINALGHDWSEATCTTPKTCKVCSATEGEALGHSYTVETVKDEALKSPATTASAAVYYKSCACGAISKSDADTFTYGEPVHAHSFTLETVKDGALKSAATCTEAAVYYKSCACGVISTSNADTFTSGSAHGHKDENRDHICDYTCGKNDMGTHADSVGDGDHACDYCGAVIGDCYDGGDADHKCDECGKAGVSQHAYTQTGSTEATCTAPATKTYTCACGDSYTENDGDALGHSIFGVTPTEKHVDGCEYVLVYECRRCHKEVNGETVYRHSYVASIRKAATCKENGVKVLKCSCGDEKTEDIPADTTGGHNWVQGTVTEGIRTDTCSVCSQTKTVTVYEGTKTDEVKADDLKDKEIELNGTNISLDNGVIDKIGDQKVTVSADKLEGDDRGDLGLTNDQLAQVGDSPIYNFTINNGSDNISQFGENNWVTITLPYQLAEGEDVDSIAIWFINDEGKLESIQATYNNGYVTFKTNHFSYYTVTRLTPAERCALYGHGYVKQQVDGGCTGDTYDLYVCIRCHNRYIDEATFVSAPGHDYNTNTQAATCTENGSTVYTCNNCGHSYTIKLPATGHKWETVSSTAATCTADGVTTYRCENCNGTRTETAARLAHQYTDTVVAPTCEASGYTSHACKTCDYSYTDAYVAALGHTYALSGWTWAPDYSSASLKLVCGRDSQHVLDQTATVTVFVLSGTCSDFVKTTYTATVSFNGTDYTDVKVVEVGTPGHQFSADWKYNDSKHWHECVCGEKNDVSDHVFGNAAVTKQPTCANAGESTSYCECGATKVTEIPATGNHSYQDGVCTGCGAQLVETYYVSLLNSWKSIDGFAVKIQDFTYEIKRPDSTLADKFKLIGSMKQIDVAELALYVENGELGGAATGSIEIFNGPIADATAVYNFKAVIYDGYVYIAVGYGKDVASQDMNMRVSVEALVNMLLEDMDIEEESTYVLEFLTDTVLPMVDTLIEANSEELNVILEKLFNMIFTFEKQTDGTYIATLDYTKLSALNDNLATKPVAEVVDLYFGEGTFNSLVEWALGVLNLEASQLPAYLDGLGISSADLIAGINKLARMTGASKDFDISAILSSSDLSGVTLGMLIFDTEDTSYVNSVNQIVNYLRSATLYSIINPDAADAIKAGVTGILEMVSGSVSFSFTTDGSGMLKSVSVNVNGFVYEDDDNQISLTFKIDLTVNGKIEVTWSDIIEKIEKGLVLPSDDLLAGSEVEAYVQGTGWGGTVTYKGKEYQYSNGVRIRAKKTLYDQISYIMVSPDCNDWAAYEICYAQKVYRFTIALITVDGTSVTILIDNFSGQVAELVQTDTGYKGILEDGTEKVFTPSSSENENMDIAKFYTDLYFAIFENPDGYVESFGMGIDYYYNAKTKEFSESTKHEYEYRYVFAVEGGCCEDGCTIYITCKNCDYSEVRTRDWCDTERATIDLSEHSTCGGTLEVSRCKVCGKIAYISDDNTRCNLSESEDIFGEDGTTVIGYRSTCPNCGLVFVVKEWSEKRSDCEYTDYEGFYIYKGETCILECVEDYYRTEHKWEYSYEMKGETCEDGYTLNRNCSVCGESDTWNSSGHRREEKGISLGDLGLCGGTVYQTYCSVCNTNLDCYFSDYACNWQYVSTDSEGYEVYTCSSCGATRRKASKDSEKNEYCQYTHTEIRIYLVNGEEVARGVSSYQSSRHDYSVSFEMNGTSCADGYTIIYTCKKCGSSNQHTDMRSHETVQLFGSDQYSSCCDNHSVSVWSCACGQEFELYFNKESFRYDETLKQYVCDECGLVISDTTGEVVNGCTVTQSICIVMTLKGEELYRYEKSLSYAKHSFTGLVSTTVDGKACITTTCAGCGAVINTQILSGTLENHDGKYYFDYTFTPDTDAVYTAVGLVGKNRFDSYVTLYRVAVGGQLVELGHNDDGASDAQFLLAYSLSAGNTYVYRISAYASLSEATEYDFALVQGAAGEAACAHSGDSSVKNYALLLGDAQTCEDGALSGNFCAACGCILNGRTVYEHREVYLDWIGNLEEFGACYGEFSYTSCACGQEYSMNFYSCAWSSTNNTYEDEEGRTVYVETKTCSECGLRYTCSYYTVKDGCTQTYVYTVTINVGDTLVFDKQYTIVTAEHDYEITLTLKAGEGSSCEDGVTVLGKCKNCEATVTREIKTHEMFALEKIDLSTLGSTCGGTVTVSGCACGKYNSLSRDGALCDMSDSWCECWIENAISKGQTTIEGVSYFYKSARVYTCAVTDPACTFKIRYASYWLKDESSCMAYQYETWQLGYNETTGTCLREITFRTGASKTYHNYTLTETDTQVNYTCPDCGSYYKRTTVQKDGYTVKSEQICSNTLDNGYNKYSEYVAEYEYDENGNVTKSRVYYKTIDSKDNEDWYENISNKQAYTGTFGENGYRESGSSKNSNGDNTEYDNAYVYYKDYRFTVYSYVNQNDSWRKYDYSYSFEDGCMQTVVYTDSEGNQRTSTENICRNYGSETVLEPTCSQSGEACLVCSVCGKRSEYREVPANDHEWMQINDDQFYCIHCGMENANGASGSIIMEDLSAEYKDSGLYVVGYCLRTNVLFDRYVSLILSDGTEVIVTDLEFSEVDGVRAVAFSKAAVAEWASQKGYTDYDIRFTFVPEGADGSLDYAITFTDPVEEVGTVTDKMFFAQCFATGDTKKYTVAPETDGMWQFAFFAKQPVYVVLYDADGDYLYDLSTDYWCCFDYVLEAGKTYTLEVKWANEQQSGNIHLLFVPM